MNMLYILAANCIITRGVQRNLLSDFQRGKVYFISEELTNAIRNGIDAQQIESSTFSTFLQQLIREDILIEMLPDELDCFTPVQESFHLPSIIHDAIIEYSEMQLLMQCANQLEQLKCKHLEIRFTQEKNYEETFNTLSVFMEYAHCSTFESVSLTLPFTLYEKYILQFHNLSTSNGKLGAVVVYAAPESFSTPLLFDKVFLIPDEHFTAKRCGNIGPLYFGVNQISYLEGRHHNTCLNRKISIDINGNIKNCPSMSETFGNIKDTTLKESIERTGFKKYWNITKDQISICKDCEFRHICTDCRAYLENPEDRYSKPLKCGYNPNTCEWEEWSTHPLKQKAIEYYGMQEIIK